MEEEYYNLLKIPQNIFYFPQFSFDKIIINQFISPSIEKQIVPLHHWNMKALIVIVMYAKEYTSQLKIDQEQKIVVFVAPEIAVQNILH